MELRNLNEYILNSEYKDMKISFEELRVMNREFSNHTDEYLENLRQSTREGIAKFIPSELVVDTELKLEGSNINNIPDTLERNAQVSNLDIEDENEPSQPKM